MGKGKKYKTGNQSEELELVMAYLGWLPEGFPNWFEWITDDSRKRSERKDFLASTESTQLKELVVESPDKSTKVTLIMDHVIIKDAFPSNFFTEEIAQVCHHYCIVALKETPLERFIIPLK